MSDLEITLTDKNFKSEILDKKGIFLVDFWASWCYPCQMLAPIIEELAREYEGKVVVGKLDVEANPVTTNGYSISGFPTVIIFKDGEVVESIRGARGKEVYQQALKKVTPSTT